MTETPQQRYRRLAGDFTQTVQAVPPDRWNNPSPCEDWTALDIVRHVVETHDMFLGLVGRSLNPAPTVDEDVEKAWISARDQVQADLDDPERAREEYDGYFGRTTFEGSVGTFLGFDLLVHRWDLARATGGDERLNLDDVREVRRRAEELGDTLRSDGVCGSALEPAPGADEQTQLLAFLGRRA
jgi:uncharacterized protein (TIGR03086 family)